MACVYECVFVKRIGFSIEVNVYGKCVEKGENDSVVFEIPMRDTHQITHFGCTCLKSMIYTHFNR